MANTYKEYIEAPTASININSSGTYNVKNYATAIVDASGKPEQEKTATPTTSQQEITPDSGYTLSKVTVNAMPNGTMGTVSATKGAVSNHSISVTPQISAGTAGYNTHAAATGSAVTVSASELVSGTLPITTNGEHDVTNYQKVNVSASKPEETFTATPKITSQTITPTEGHVFSSGTVNPIYEEISTSASMDSNKVAANEGKMYKFTGTTDSTYTRNRYYILKEYENPVPVAGGLSVTQFMNITQNNDTLEVQ